MKLYEIPNGSKLHIKTDKGWEFLIFKHIEGMYSLITREPNDGKYLYLSAITLLKKVKDYYELTNTGSHP